MAIDPECYLYGDLFFPSKLRERIPNVEMRGIIEPGEIRAVGKYQGKPAPYGACYIVTPENIGEDRIEWMADFIAQHMESFKAAGADDIVYWLYWTGLQGNMELRPVELRKLADLGIPLAIDYTYETDELV